MIEVIMHFLIKDKYDLQDLQVRRSNLQFYIICEPITVNCSAHHIVQPLPLLNVKIGYW